MKRPALFLIVGVLLLGGAGWAGATVFGNDSSAAVPAAVSARPAVRQADARASDARCAGLVGKLRGRALSDGELRQVLRRHPECPAVVVDAPPGAAGRSRVVTLPPTGSVASQPSGGFYEDEGDDEFEDDDEYEHESDEHESEEHEDEGGESD